MILKRKQIRDRDGRGAAQDYAEAVKWYRKAGGQGLAWAQLALGLMHRDGHGVPQDFGHAYVWFSLAAAKGMEDAARFPDAAREKSTAEQETESQQLAAKLFNPVKPKNGS